MKINEFLKTASNRNNSKDTTNLNLKRIEESKIFTKKLILNNLSTNIHQGKFEEIMVNLKKISLLSNSNTLSMELILLDIYFCLIHLFKYDSRSFQLSLKKMFCKIKEINYEFNYSISEIDRILFFQLGFELITILLQELTHQTKINIPSLFKNHELLLISLFDHNHLSIFSNLLGFLSFTKLNNNLKEKYLSNLKDLLANSNHVEDMKKVVFYPENNKIDIPEYKDQFCRSINELLTSLSRSKEKPKPIKVFLSRKCSAIKSKTQKESVTPIRKIITPKINKKIPGLNRIEFKEHLCNLKINGSPINHKNYFNSTRSVSELKINKKSNDVSKHNCSSTKDMSQVSPLPNSTKINLKDNVGFFNLHSSGVRTEENLNHKTENYGTIQKNFSSVFNILNKIKVNLDNLEDEISNYENKRNSLTEEIKR